MAKQFNFDFSTYGDQEKPVEKEPAKVAEVVETTPFDLVKVSKHESFLKLKTKISEMEIKAKDLVIKTEADRDTALQMRIQLRAFVDSAAQIKDRLPGFSVAAKFKRGVDKFLRETFKQPVARIDSLIVPKITFYSQTQAKLQKQIDDKAAKDAAVIAEANAKKDADEKAATDQKNRDDAIALQGELNLKADNAGVDRVAVPIPPEVPEPESIPVPLEAPAIQVSKKITADHGSAKIEPVWRCLIETPNSVPVEFCSPDQKKLDAAVEAGVRKIPGCKIEESFDQKIRLSRKKTNKVDNWKF